MAEITEALNSEANDGNNNEANDDNNNVGNNQNENSSSTENQEVTLVVPRPPALPPRPPNLVLPHAGAIPRVPPAPYVMQSGKPNKAKLRPLFVSKSFILSSICTTIDPCRSFSRKKLGF